VEGENSGQRNNF